MSNQELLLDSTSTNSDLLNIDPLPLIVGDSLFENKHGSIRAALVRKYYGFAKLDESSPRVQLKTLDREDLRDITRLFVDWRNSVEYMPIRYTFKTSTFKNFENTQGSPSKWVDSYTTNTGLFACMFNDDPDCKLVAYEKHVRRWALKESCKRGNDVYINLVNDKFKPLFAGAAKHKEFFSTTINKNRKRVRKTSMLYLTGTISPEYEHRPKSKYYRTLDVAYAWMHFGKFWNGFVSNLRQFFGKIDYIRSWQSQDNYYPHFHTIVVFHNFKFTSTQWQEKDGSTSWRVHNRQKHKGVLVRERLKDAWKWGGLDIKCVDNSKKALRDLIKYVTHDLQGGASNKTNAMVWYFGKQSFAISRKFFKRFGVSIAKAEPGNADLINASGVIKRSNSNEVLVKIEIFPILPAYLFDKSYQKDVLDPDLEPDPPPKVVNFLNNYVDSCTYSEKIREDGVIIQLYKQKMD